jgi:adenylyltransferase/sulfurtransferase
MELTKEEQLRYSRQIMIPEIGEEGQKKIKAAKVFVGGIGGLGSISSYYLAAAGVGHLKIVDKDRVELTNLNRQIIHWTGDIGEPKAESGGRKLRSLNPNCSIEAVQAEITEDSASGLIGDCALIVDAMDNMRGRRILNAASIRLGIPYIYAGVHHLDGMVTTFIPGRTPCLDCVFPASDKETSSPPPGVLGPAPGLIACIQVIEAVKIILGMPGLLAGRLLSFSGYDITFREFKILKDPKCPVCGKGASMQPGL